MQNMDNAHRDIFSRAISVILSTEICESTYTQIVDGLPTPGIFRDRYNRGLDIRHPLIKHTMLCPGVMDKTRQFRGSFDPRILKFYNRVGLANNRYRALTYTLNCFFLL